MDLKSLSLRELNTLNQRITREIEVRERVGKADVIKLRKAGGCRRVRLRGAAQLAAASASHGPGKAKQARKAVAKQKAMSPLPVEPSPCNLSEYTVLLQSGGWR
jgi:ribosomal protein L19E